MIAEARGIASIPDELSSAKAAPLLCAGITTYNALRNAGLRGGDLVAVHGIGGLGIWGSSLRDTWDSVLSPSGAEARRKKLAKNWAHMSTSIPPSMMLQQHCSVWAEQSYSRNSPSGSAMGPLVSGLAARGKFIVVVYRRTRCN